MSAMEGLVETVGDTIRDRIRENLLEGMAPIESWSIDDKINFDNAVLDILKSVSVNTHLVDACHIVFVRGGALAVQFSEGNVVEICKHRSGRCARLAARKDVNSKVIVTYSVKYPDLQMQNS